MCVIYSVYDAAVSQHRLVVTGRWGKTMMEDMHPEAIAENLVRQ
jgi:hypothetical protein